jgi:glycosyltransferase involved in cell wall biosynthesis
MHIITRLILGGAQENTLYNCEDLLREHADDVLLVTGPAEGPEGDLFERARRHQVPIEIVPDLCRAIGPLADLRATRRLTEIVQRFQPDVVHTHSSKAGILGRAVAWNEKVPAVIHTIHGLAFHPYERWWKNAIYIRAERWAARRCDRIISVADAMTKQALAQKIGRAEQYITIHSGMEVEPFLACDQFRKTTRQRLGIADNEVVVMKVARLFEWKGHEDVIQAAKLLASDAPSIRFVFVGGGTWRDRLERQIAQAGLANRFIFTGLVPSGEIPSLLSASDIVVHASYREGLARVLPQSLIAGRPVISYDVDGAREVVLPDRTGCLLAPHDIVGLARSIEELARDAPRRTRFGRTGQSLFQDLFRHEVMTRKIREVYAETLASKSERSRSTSKE